MYTVLEQLYEGKAKKVFKLDRDSQYLIRYKDDATAFNGEKKGQISDKGIVNNRLSALLFEMLEKKGINTHFVELVSDRESIVKAVEIVPLEVIVRNIACGSLSKRLGIEEGVVLDAPILELCYKNDELGDPMINDDHAIVLGYCTKDELSKIKRYALDINKYLQEFFLQRKITLVDFKLEFGRYKGEIILADEISPDTCRLWDVDTGKRLDKDRFRRDLGDVEEAYKEVLGRMI